MRIAHIGPRLAQRGGPAGYLLQLSRAAKRFGGASPHRLTFPEPDPAIPERSAGLARRVRSALRPVKRALVGPPSFFRPRDDDMRRVGGAVEALLTAAKQTMCEEASASIEAAIAGGADVLVAHDPCVAERLLDVRRTNQQVWLIAHAPMPLGLDVAWSWGVPEWPWEAIRSLPDVCAWIDWEIAVCSSVDRLITPCAEGVAELTRVDRRFATLPFEFVRTGAEARARAFPDQTPAQLRARWRLPIGEPVALFLGNPLPYRGLDVLLDAVAAIPPDVPGIVALAGSTRGEERRHPRLRLLGRVHEVADLLHAVDFVVNVNRFSLFDLSIIEAAEAGRAMLLHATGGNISFERLGVGAVMVHDLDAASVARALAYCFTMPAARRAALGAASRRCHAHHLTLEQFWQAHTALYDRAIAGAVASTHA
jgi:glycosyltransferase involved in cell wall biosynthesis